MNIFPRFGLSRLLLATALVAVLAAAPAYAQPGDRGGFRGRGGPGGGPGGPGGPGARMMQPDYLRRDMPLIVDHLALDKHQAAIAETLLMDYEAAFAEAAEQVRDRFMELRPQRPEPSEEERAQRDAMRQEMRALREEIRAVRRATREGQAIDEEAMAKLRERMEANRQRFDEMRPRMDPEEMQAMRESFRDLFREWRRERDVLNDRFESDLRAILTPPQIEQHWPSFERTMRRQKTMQRGQLSGESADLFLVLREAGIEPNAVDALEPLLDAYALDLDQALIARNEWLDNGREAVMDAMFGDDVERAVRLLEDEKQLRLAVRGVNERYAEAIAATLAESGTAGQVEAFRQGFRQRAYERVYRTTGMQRSFRAALDLEGLSDETLVAIMGLEDRYLTELDAQNAEILRTLRAEEPDEITQRARRMAERFSGEGGPGRRGGWGRNRGPDGDDPIRQAFQSRSELDRSYRAQLEALLSPEQIEALPPLRQRGQGWGDDGQRARMRQRMVEEFDKDGDGELNDEEREAARAEWRQQRGEGRRGRRGGGGDDA